MIDPERVAKTESIFRNACEANGWWISPDGRIGAGDVEKLLGWSEGTFKYRARMGTAPHAYRIGRAGHKLTVRLIDLAEWMEAQQFAADT